MLGLNDEQLSASYPGKIADRLGLAPIWLPQLAALNEIEPGLVMPHLAQLTEGMEAMLE